MFRTAILRSAARAAAATARPVVVRRSILAAAAAPRVAALAPRVQSLQAVRMYSAAGALNKDEVEGRIISLLQGFDKVSFCHVLGEGPPRGILPVLLAMASVFDDEPSELLRVQLSRLFRWRHSVMPDSRRHCQT